MIFTNPLFISIATLSYIALCFFTSVSGKWKILSAGSIIFYTLYSPLNMLLITLTTAGDMYFTRSFSRQPERNQLVKAILLNLTPLFLFKFLHTVSETGLKFEGDAIILPLGISYFTFRKISYLIDCYRGNTTHISSIIRLLLYYLYLPSVVAGPIERAGNFFSNLAADKDLSCYNLRVESLRRTGVGLLKKFAIANYLATFTSSAFSTQGSDGDPLITIAIFLYSLEIYMDFSGYTDIAIGLSGLAGIPLPENFSKPYSATSLSQFWQRWHITLTQWLRDYIFLPLAMKLSGRFRGIRSDYINYTLSSVLTMTICGLWHGFTVTFLLWGSIHGVILSIGFVTKKLRKRVIKKFRFNQLTGALKYFRISVTFLTVTVLWVLFRASSTGDALSTITRGIKGIPKIPSIMPELLNMPSLIAPLLFTLFTILFEKYIKKSHTLIRWTLYFVLVSAVTATLIINNGSTIPGEFIYNGF